MIFPSGVRQASVCTVSLIRGPSPETAKEGDTPIPAVTLEMGLPSGFSTQVEPAVTTPSLRDEVCIWLSRYRPPGLVSHNGV